MKEEGGVTEIFGVFHEKECSTEKVFRTFSDKRRGGITVSTAIIFISVTLAVAWRASLSRRRRARAMARTQSAHTTTPQLTTRGA